MFVSPLQEVEITATSWVICSSCSAWSAGWSTAAFPVSRDTPPLLHFFAPIPFPRWPLHLPSDWRIHCATSYAKDGFWLYLTQIASCSPWMFWMFLNSVFHFMWVAVLIMCQLYQVWGFSLPVCDTPLLKTQWKHYWQLSLWPLLPLVDRGFGNHHQREDERSEIQAL